MNFKKGISVGLALSLVLGSNVSAFAMPNELTKSIADNKERIMVLQAQIQEEDTLKKLKDSDKVRVIVELEGEAVIQKATEKGLKVDEMNKDEVKSIQKSILKEQNSIQNKIENEDVSFEVINSFTNVANGFSMETTLGDAKKIEGIKGIKSVTIANEYDRPEPYMNNSGEITNTTPTWNIGYNGEGTVISIIDTGVDSTHRDMVVTNPKNAELQIEEVQAMINKSGLPGTYRTSKVAYGYNYMDENQEILDLGPDASMHGMHVAGIAAANGDVDNGGIKGTAPEAQVLAMKVFGNDPSMPSTFGDVIVKAIDDSIILGADVINMSLGSTASYVDDNDLEQKAVNKAVENGVVASISAGNSNVFGSGYDNPYVANPDYGVVGAPGIATDSLQVASIENNVMSGYSLEYEINGKAGIAPYTTAGPNMLEMFKGQKLKVVDCGLGSSSENFTEEVKGNIALVQRGISTFQEKITNAQNAGAIGVVVYNSAAGGDGLMNMAYEGDLPAIFIGESHGTALSNESKIKDTTVVLNGNAASAANPSAGKMSSFTSWGLTPDLEFKPEITGVGGNVWSTANNNGYQNMSGTSMAAPNVAGGSALVLQRVDKEFGLTGEARAKMAKKLLMSTATPHVDNGNLQKYGVVAGANYTSPRRQGAGVMDLYGASTTPAIVTDSTTNECKVNLKEIKGDNATFTITVENFSDKEATYNLNGTVQTDLADDKYTYLQAQNLIDASSKKFPISFSNENITVPAKGKVDVTVNVDLSNAITSFGEMPIEEVFANGGYVEGFVTLTDPTDTNPELNIPYVGFKGEWDKVPVIDATVYDKIEDQFYGYTSIATDVGGDSYDFLGIDAAGKVADGEKIAFSPNGDGVNDTITPILSYLRNAKDLEVEILDSKGNVIRTVDKEEELTKHYFDGKYAKYSILTDATWNGEADNKVVADGQYTYRVKSKIDFKDAEWQNLDFKVTVDTVKPTVKSVNYDKGTKQLVVVGEDNNPGHIYKYVLVKAGEEIASNDTGKFDLSDVDYRECSVEIHDYARNKEVINLEQAISGEFKEPTGPAEGDKTIPTIMVTGPEFFGIYNTNKINVVGTVKDASAMSEFTVNGKNVPLTFDTHTGVWKFSTEIELKDGYHSIMVAGRDAANNKIEFAHKIFVDALAPTIELDKIPTETTRDSIIISGKLNDNLPNMKIKVNGNAVASVGDDWEFFDKLPAASYDLAYEVQLQDGENKVIVEAIDDAGNATTKEVVINKVDSICEAESAKLIGLDRYKTAVEVSKSGWTTSDVAVIANGYAYADALVAAPLAANYDAPILLTETEKLQSDTKAELDRLGVKTVYVVGGTGVVSDAAVTEMSKAGINVVRLFGDDRYETSVAVANHLDRQQNITNVYVSNGHAPADALTIASKAAAEKSPIILVEEKSIPKKVSSWLKDQKLKSAYVIGGDGVVSNSVMKSLNKLTSDDITNNRIGGIDRYETNALVMEKFFEKEQQGVYVTESVKLVDSLVVAPLAARTNSPIIITRDALSDKQGAVADSMTSKKVIEVGGEVNKSVVKDLINRLNK